MKHQRHVLVVADKPPKSNPNQPPLFGSVRRRLQAILGFGDRETMLRMVDSAYVFPEPCDRWDDEAANVRATTLGICSLASLIVMLGDRVTKAFGGEDGFSPIPGFNRTIIGLSFPNLKGKLGSLPLLTRQGRVVRAVAAGIRVETLVCTVHGDETVCTSNLNRINFACGCEVLA